MAAGVGDDELLAVTVSHLIKALRALGRTGDPDAANRLAAKAWLSLRDQQPRQAERLNGAMHYLAKLPQTTAPGIPPTDEEER